MRKIIARKETKIGKVYNPAAIWAKVKIGDAAKKQNIQVVIINALKYTGFQFLGISIERPFVKAANKISKKILPIDLIN